MHLRKLLIIFQKDLLDAIRDARVFMAILAPLAVGILYNVIYNDEPPRPAAAVAYWSPEPSGVIDALRQTAGQTVDLSVTSAGDASTVRRLVEDKKADIGLVLPAGFDRAIAEHQAPQFGVILPASPTFGGDYVAAALEPTLRQLAGQGPVATIQVDRLTSTTLGSPSVLTQLGVRSYLVLSALVMLVAMIAMLALPVILVEEVEKKTIDALALIASYADVVVAKTLVGVVYITLSTGLLLAVTRMWPANLPLFIGAMILLSVTLIGLGLLLGGLFRSANQLNTWSGLFILPVILPIFLVAIDAPRLVHTVIELLPTPQATQLIINGMTGNAIFQREWLSLLIVASWAAAIYALLLWRLAHRAE